MRRVRDRGMSPFAAGLLTLVLAAVVGYFGYTKANPLANPFELRAAMRDAGGVKAGAPVRVAGVDVGKVASVEPAGDGSKGATVVLELQDKGLPVHRDATLKVRPRIFLEGNTFVDLRPGSPSAPHLSDGATLPVGQTAAPVSFGQVLDTLQRDTREDLRLLLQELGDAYSEGGADAANRAIRWWSPAFRGTAVVNEATLGERPRDLSGYVAGAGEVARALDRDPEALKGLVDDLATTADALADQESRLQRGIGLLDDTLITGRDALGELNGALPPLRRLVAELRPAARAARPALDAQLPLVRELRALTAPKELRGLVRELRPVVPDLAELNEGGVELQEQARLLGSCQNEVVLPTTSSTIQDPFVPAKGKVFQEAVKWLPGVAGESRSFDGNGQYIKTVAQTLNYAYLLGNGRLFGTSVPLQGVNPPPQRMSPLRPDVPCETQEAPDLRTDPADPPTPIKVDHTSKAAVARAEVATKRTVDWLRNRLKLDGLDRRFRVSVKPLVERDLQGVLRRRP
ncbi:MlaD family protein [Conexibacter sp. SYSU D00693]|uniref:MlaD family protein n=1 Tax=Conexibacter sp. SYSU D00693 TaxID=2812560 RepID=UPI00196A8739|nr:MlaD family protein [Conexibacter sp. SYSU D00693]